MDFHVTDLPLELFEFTLSLFLAIAILLQQLALRREKAESQRKLDEANEELKHVRRMLDRILLVDRGYARPGEPLEEDEAKPRSQKPVNKL